MTSITKPKTYAIAFDFYETDVVEKNQEAAGNNLFQPIRQKYGDRLLELQVLKETGLFDQDGLFKEPQLFEWTVSEQTADGPKITSGHCSEALQLLRRYKGRILF
ncbi:hypothetical protein FPCIR_7935 [Fusarium pseudocircinatum]|uniref:Uncharacterized protein n=1 Tax=Fusarium pseudocircinatum TaxID=56676 RepID=A0A8H5P0G6_9HYPO|nr:hypothetical protein FPCIR_7935 [Fusarium pseudocircinatum]